MAPKLGNDNIPTLTLEQVKKEMALATFAQKALNQADVAEGVKQLSICIGCLGKIKRAVFGDDPSKLYVLPSHPWDCIHSSHKLTRCDVTIAYHRCGASRSGYQTVALDNLWPRRPKDTSR